MIYLIALGLVYFLHVLLKLNWLTTAGLLLFAVYSVSKHKKRYIEGKTQEKRFQEVSLYLDTLLYSFTKEEKIEPALESVYQSLAQGNMKNLVNEALDYLHMTFDKTEVLETTLSMIEEKYACKRLHDVHQFMTHVEYYGGDVESPVALLLADKTRWEKRITGEIERRKKKLIDIMISVGMSLGICGAILYMPVMHIDISQNPFVQLCSFVVIVLSDLIIYRGQRYLTVDWLHLQLREEEEYYAKRMKDFLSYDEDGERKHSLIWGGTGLVFCLGAFCFLNEWVVVVCLIITMVLFNQHRIGKGLIRKSLLREIKYAFPNWLLDLVLLLQSENVYVALEKSKEHVPGVLREELSLLTERLEMEPESSAPYHKFLESFEIPEIDSAMGILFSLSVGNSGNADKQIGELVAKNLELLDTSEVELLQGKASGMYVLFLLPVLVASLKLMVDMVFLMLSFLQLPVF